MIDKVIDLAKRDGKFKHKLIEAILREFGMELDEYFLIQHSEEGLINVGG